MGGSTSEKSAAVPQDRPAPQDRPILEMRGISKSFPGVIALKEVDFSVRRGEVVGLLGENGAGKSTLMKILTGVYQPNEGELLWDGGPRRFETIREAQEKGISIIFQELNNCPNLSALENLFLGRELRTKTGLLDFAAMREGAAALFERLDVKVELGRPVGRLSTAIQQMIEIAKALLTEVKLLIMDEPTSSLTTHETEKLFQVIAELKAKGISVIFISHKLDEVFRITDRIVVLRDGENAGELETGKATVDQLVALMVGRELKDFFSSREAGPSDEVVLRVEGLAGPPMIRDVSFELRKGEILGFAGLIGAGRTETARLLIGAARKTAGRILLGGAEVDIASPKAAVAKGIAYLPEDRKMQALILGMTVRENVTMAVHGLLRKFLVMLDRRKELKIAESSIDSLGIKVSGTEQIVRNLSGGNQQKVVIAKWLAAKPRILILDEPTRGIDVRAKSEVHRLIAELADSGVSIILISSELPEIVALADRVLVMHEGGVKGILPRAGLTQQAVMTAVFGTG
ncbi:MAG TPA: sugar ABC transporter ATP-binding protein [Rectinemataceae bacterium]|nr:sugar ABC transporter ATP-binding protein [Rectinemataceae bacterium]